MRVIVATRPGPPGILQPQTVDDPHPGPGQVRVRVSVSAVTFIDTRMRAGSPIGPPASFPYIPGNGVAGVVDETGPGTGNWLGATVVTTTGGSGGYAEMAVASAKDLLRIPHGLDERRAAALLADGRTAVGLFEAAGPARGETVVVTAAAGGVGSLLVQLARAAGATVVALAGSEKKLGIARERGADVAVNYELPGWERELSRQVPDGVDVVFDGVGGPVTEALFASIRPGGRYVQHGASGGRWTEIDPGEASRRGVGVIGLSAIGAGADAMRRFTVRALDLAAEGRIDPLIGQVFPLAEAARAHARIEARQAIGKTLLLPASTPHPQNQHMC